MPTSGPPHGRPGVVLAGGLLALLAYLATELYVLDGGLGFPLDDSWIHLQFARNLAGGEGLSYQGGELVTGSTAPLWTALLSLLFLLPGSPLAWAKLVGAGLYLAGLDATRRLARELGVAAGPARLAAGLTGATTWLVWSALSGMEVPLFVLLSLWGIVLHLRERREPERPPLALPVLAVAVLARPEGALLLLLALGDRALVMERRGDGWALGRPPWGRLGAGLGAAAVLLVPVAAFYARVGGEPLPSTWGAKSALGYTLLPDPRYLDRVLGIFFYDPQHAGDLVTFCQPFATLLAAGGALVLVSRLGSAADRGLLPALWLLGLPLAHSLVGPNPGNFGRYLFPLFPVLVVLAILALEPAWRTVAAGLSAPARRRAAAVGVLLLLLPTLVGLALGAPRYAQTVANVEDSDVRMARWLGERLPPEAVLAVNDIGALKYLLPNRVLDLGGIVHPRVTRYVRRAQAAGRPWEEGVLRFLEEGRPDYLVIFPNWYPMLAGDGRFEPVRVLEIPNNITMGGDRLAVFSTPWTRYPLAGVDVPPPPAEGG